MKVLHLISSGGMYGAEAVILGLSAEMNRGGTNVSSLGVFSHDPERVPALHAAALEAGVASQLIPCRGQVDRLVGDALRQLVCQTEAEVVHAHGYKADIYACWSLRGKGRPALVSTCHTWYDNDLAVRVYGAADRWVLRRFDEVVAVSAEVADRLLKASVSRGKVRLVRNGIEVGRFAGAADGRKYSAEGDTALRVGLVGRLAPEKGVDLFLKAAAEVAGRVPGTEFLVAGEGPERNALEGLLGELGLNGRVRLVGQQADMAAFYASLDLLVSASRQEGLPIALLEAMASGLPVVATRVGEVPSVVLEGETGLLVEANSPERLAAAMERLLLDGAMQERFGRAGRDRVVADFSVQRMAAEYMAVYRSALAGRDGARAAVRRQQSRV